MKHNLFLLAGALSTITLVSACNTPKEQTEIVISGADVSKGVTNISKDGKSFSFTIPEGAREFDDAAQGALSAIYDKERGTPEDCPKVSSTKVSKNVDDYDALSGKAKITANFTESQTAGDVYDAGCLIIDDT